MDPTTDSTLKNVETFLLEMTSLFPSGFIHLGGDEVDPGHWRANTRVGEYMKGNGLDGPKDLLVHFHNGVLDRVHGHGFQSIGWDPLTTPSLDSRAIVQSVRGQEWVARAIRGGHRAIASSEYYLDAMLPASHHYLSDPFDGEVSEATDEERALILGGEASMWTEFATADNIDSRIWPRAAAVAERLWSPREVRDVDDLYRRLPGVSRRLDAASGVMHNLGPKQMLLDLAEGSSIVAVQILTDAVEPVTLKTRWESLADYTTSTPLNRLVDIAVPDGEGPRVFVANVAAFVADPSHDDTYHPLRGDLLLWKSSHLRLVGTRTHSARLAEIVPVARALADVAEVGLACLEALRASKVMARAEREVHRVVLDSARHPIADVTLAVLPGILTLLEAVPEEVGSARSE